MTTENTAKMSEAKDVTIINPSPSGDVEKVIEAVAEAWASIDGKLDEFRREKALTEPLENLLERPEFVGTYIGYLSEAEEMIRRLEARGFKIVPTTYAEDNERQRAELKAYAANAPRLSDHKKLMNDVERLTRDLTTAQAEIEKLRGENERLKADREEYLSGSCVCQWQAQAEEMKKALEEDGQTITIRERLIDRRYDWQIVAIRPERITTLQSFGPGKAGEEAAIAALSLMKGGE